MSDVIISPQVAWDAWRRAYMNVTGRSLPSYGYLSPSDSQSWQTFCREMGRILAVATASNVDLETKISGLRFEVKTCREQIKALLGELSEVKAKLEQAKKIPRPVRFNELGRYERLDFVRYPITACEALQSRDAEFTEILTESQDAEDAVRVILEKNDECRVVAVLGRKKKAS